MAIDGVNRRRRFRLSFLALLVPALVAVPVPLLRDAARDRGRSAVCAELLRLPTTRIAPRSQADFTVSVQTPYLIVPPDTYYGFTSLGQLAGAGTCDGGLLLWMSGSRGAANSAPARGDGMLFIPTDAGAVVALDERARGVVFTLTPSRPSTHVLFSDTTRRLIVADASQLTAYDVATGTPSPVWTCDAGGSILTAPTQSVDADGTIHLVVTDAAPGPGTPSAPAGLIAVDSANGRLRWRAPLSPVYFEAPAAGRPRRPSPGPSTHVAAPAADARTVYCAFRPSDSPTTVVVAAFDAQTGHHRWTSADLSGEHAFDGPRPASPAIVDAELACVTVGDAVVGLNATDGVTRWRWRSPPARVAGGRGVAPVGPPLVRDDVAFVATASDVVALDARVGRVLRISRSGGHPDPKAPPTLAGNLLFTADSFGEIAARALFPADAPPKPAPPPTALSARPLSLIATAVATLLMLALAIIFRRLKAGLALASLALCAAVALLWADSYKCHTFFGARDLLTAAPPRIPTRRGPVRVRAGGHRAETAHGLFSGDGSLALGTRRTVVETSIPRPLLGDPNHRFWLTRAPLRPVLSQGVYLEDPPADLGLTRFAWTNRSRPSGTALGNQAETTLTVPHWLAVVLLAVLPLAWLSGHWRDRPRHPKGHRARCGYDLRASPAQCPECGHQPK